MTTPHTIPDLKKQVQAEYQDCKDINNPEWLDSVIDRTLAISKEATLLEEKEKIQGTALVYGWNEYRQAQLKKWEELLGTKNV
jgi:hypothetical protein